MKRLLTITFATLALALFACGGDKDEDKGKGKGGSDDKGEKAGDEPSGGAGPALDCDAFAEKMNECLDAFAPLYAKTEMGSKAGKDMDGNVDHDKAAERFKTLWGLEGAKLCTGPQDMITAYNDRDARWKKRFNECDPSASCDEWAPCMATAVGELLPN